MKNLYKPIHKRVCVILTLVLLSVALTGCTIPISFNMPSNSAMTIPKTAFSQSADTTEEIVQAIIASMDSDNNVCELFITDEELIDANKFTKSGILTVKVRCISVHNKELGTS